jgi:hypothetical protein
MIRTTVAALVVWLVAVPAAWAQAPSGRSQSQTQSRTQSQTQTKNLAEYAELLRSDVRAQKVAIITEVMEFSEADSAAFWPIYRAYDAEMAKLGDERVALIAEYAKNYDTLTDANADSLAKRAIDVEARRRETLAKCYDNVRKALGAKTALRFLQVEHQLLLIIDLQIASSLPIVG